MGHIWYVDIETATTLERYKDYLTRRSVYDRTLKPAKSAEERAALHAGGPRMVHGDDPRRDKIVSIQLQRLTGLEPGEVSPLIRLTEWSHPGGEKGILRQFNDITKFFDQKWGCVMTGFNLAFEKEWFAHKGVAYGLVPWGKAEDIWQRPCVDLHHVAMLFNADNTLPFGMRGDVPAMMVGASLDNFSRKRGKGAAVTRLYHEKRFQAIEDYTVQEARAFVELWDLLVEEMPFIWRSKVAPKVGREPFEKKVSDALLASGLDTDDSDERNRVGGAG